MLNQERAHFYPLEKVIQFLEQLEPQSQWKVFQHPEKKPLPRLPLFQCLYSDVDFSSSIFSNLQNNTGQGKWGKRKPLESL